MSAPLPLRPVAVAFLPSKKRRRRRWRVASAALLFVVIGFVALVLHPELPEPPLALHDPVRGAYHVHSEASHDSRVPLDTYAKAAKARRLDFLVFTEHDVQAPAAEVRDGVLFIHQSEANTPYGHVVPLGASRALNAVERSDAHCVARAEDVGGHAIVAHPTSRKRPWTGPLTHARGIEVQNAAATLEAYMGPWWWPALPLTLTYLLRPELALAQLYARDAQAHATWDALPSNAVGLAANDAHGWLKSTWDIAAWQVVAPTLRRPPVMTPAFADEVVNAMLSGEIYASAGLFETPLDLTLVHDKSDKDAAGARDVLRACAGQHADDAFRVVLLRDGTELASSPLPCLEHAEPRPGVYRAELRAHMPTLYGGYKEALLAFGPRLVVNAPSP